jgi:putative ABC transport system permease protein
VLGATVPAIIRFISKEFAILVGLSVVIAFPIAFWITSRWLGSFAYRIGLSWWIFAGSGAVVVAITLLTMAWRSRKAAASNPIDALRYE